MLEQCLAKHLLLAWDGNISEKNLEANEGIIGAILELCPHRVPTVSELTGGFLALDQAYSLALSACKSKRAQRQWCQLEAEKLREMLAHVRRRVRKSETTCSRL